MKIFKKRFGLSDYKKDIERFNEAEKDRDRLINYASKRNKECYDVTLEQVRDMTKEINKFLEEHKN